MPIFQQSGLKYGSYYSEPPKHKVFSMNRYLIIGLAVAFVLSAILLVVPLITGNAKADVTLFAARENSLLQVATGAQTNIRDPDLTTANSNATILLTSDVASILNTTGDKKLDPNLVKQEADTNGDKLRQAGLLDKYDTTYRQIMLDKVAALTSQARSLRARNIGKKTNAALDQALINLSSISAQFTALNL